MGCHPNPIDELHHFQRGRLKPPTRFLHADRLKFSTVITNSPQQRTSCCAARIAEVECKDGECSKSVSPDALEIHRCVAPEAWEWRLVGVTIPKWPQDSGWWIIISFTQMIFMVFLLSYHRQDTSGERLGVDSWIFQRVVEKLDNKSLAHRTQMSCENMA